MSPASRFLALVSACVFVAACQQLPAPVAPEGVPEPGASPAAPASAGPLAISARATFRGAPLADAPVSVFDARSGEPASVVAVGAGHLGDAGPAPTAGVIAVGAGHAQGAANAAGVVAVGAGHLRTDANGGLDLSVSGLAPGEAAQVVVQAGANALSVTLLGTANGVVAVGAGHVIAVGAGHYRLAQGTAAAPLAIDETSTVMAQVASGPLRLSAALTPAAAAPALEAFARAVAPLAGPLPGRFAAEPIAANRAVEALDAATGRTRDPAAVAGLLSGAQPQLRGACRDVLVALDAAARRPENRSGGAPQAPVALVGTGLSASVAAGGAIRVRTASGGEVAPDAPEAFAGASGRSGGSGAQPPVVDPPLDVWPSLVPDWPSPTPSAAPSAAPSPSPSAAPSAPPSAAPSASPSAPASAAPSPSPSVAPSPSPSPLSAVEAFVGDRLLSGMAAGAGAAARFSSPGGLALRADGSVAIADGGNHRLRLATPLGAVSTLAGTGVLGFLDGLLGIALLGSPAAAAYDAGLDAFYVFDAGNYRIRRVSAAGVVSVGGNGLPGALLTGAFTSDNVRDVGGLAAGAGAVYFTERGLHVLRRLDLATGAMAVVAGSAGSAGAADGAGAAARFSAPEGVAIAGGKVYVADSGNHAVRCYDPTTGQVSTYAGQLGTPGDADGTGAAARFRGPRGLAADASGTLYVADTLNHRLKQVAPGGASTALAGTGAAGGANASPATAASFDSPFALAVTADGRTLYALEAGRHAVRRVTR